MGGGQILWSGSIEERYENLKYKYEKLQKEYDDLQERFKKTDDELYRANFRIKHELEPRIKSEMNVYDNYVLSGGDSCFSQGMNGGCGIQCPNFGQEENCRELISEMSNKELLKYYTDNEAFDCIPVIREELIDRELEKEVRNIDDQYCRQCIADLNKKIEGTKQIIELYQNVLVNGYQE